MVELNDCICKFPRDYGGRKPVRPTSILKDDGQLTKGPGAGVFVSAF